jgi:ribonuclease HI
LKINVDGAFHPDSHTGGIGVIVRDGEGFCVAAFHRSITHGMSATHVEAEACRAGLLIAIQQGWDDVILETDCATMAAALAKPDDDLSEIGRIIGDCKDYMLAFTSLSIRHVYREANRVAHRLAHVASFSSVDELWIDDTPSIIEDVIYEDVSRTRGIGFMSPSMYNVSHRS